MAFAVEYRMSRPFIDRVLAGCGRTMRMRNCLLIFATDGSLKSDRIYK